MHNSRSLVTACAILLVVATAGAAHANVVYTVTMDTSAISGGLGYALAFQLNDGSGTDDANNTVTLSNFTFGGGSAGVCCTVLGGATGDIGSVVTLTDSSFFNTLAQGFTPGTSLSFKLDMTTNLDAGGTPDLFGFSILLDGDALPTTDDLGANTFLYVNIDSANPTPQAWPTDPQSPVALSAPSVASGSVAVPQPGSLLLLATGVLGLAGLVRRRVVMK